jgi:NADPH2:quinone reductase
MRAIGCTEYGGLEVIKELGIKKPIPGPGEVLIKIHAAGANPVDYKIRQGRLKDRMPNIFPIVFGWDAAGTIEAASEGIGDFSIGDEVFAYTRKDTIHDGTYAEYIAVPAEFVCGKPDGLSMSEAAAIPLAGLTAYQSLIETAGLTGRETVLIHAGAGGVGGFAVQIAKNVGATVISTAGEKNHDYVKTLGADYVIDYTKHDFRDAVGELYPDGVDVVYDTVGGDVYQKSLEVIKKGGRMVSILQKPEPELEKNYGITTQYVFVRPDGKQLGVLKKMAEAGTLFTKVTEIPLDNAAKAHRMLESRHVTGKIVLMVV